MKKNIIISFSFFVILFIWLASGVFKTDEPDESKNEINNNVTLTVAVKELDANGIKEEVVLSGKTKPKREVSLRAEVEGAVIETFKDRGAIVAQGDLIFKIDERAIPQRKSEAEALVSQRELEYKAAEDLRAKNLISDASLAESMANLASARAELKAASLDLKNTEVRAPFDGVLHSRSVEIGNYVRNGDEVGRVLQNKPLLSEGEVTEKDISKLELGVECSVFFTSGEMLQGKVSYIEPTSDPGSRTFTVEVEIENNQNRPAGESTKVIIPTHTVSAHKISQSMLTINDKGDIGVKIVDENNKVQFLKANIIKTSTDAVWLRDLPQTIRLITRGQGFAVEGETVNVRVEQESQN